MIRSLNTLYSIQARSNSFNSISKRLLTSSLIHIGSNSIGLTEEQMLLQNMAREFSNKELYPNAPKWDEKKIFPEEALRNAAALGLGGMFVREDIGGTQMSRLDGNIVLEELASGCTSTSAYLSIHNSELLLLLFHLFFCPFYC